MGRIVPHSVFRGLYNTFVRDLFPERITVQNGVAVRGPSRLLDRSDVFPDYEGPLIDGLRSCVSSGDDIVIVGGGRGVSTVAAATLTGNGGTVQTFEATEQNATRVEATSELNKVDERVTVVHGIVGQYSEFSQDYYGGAENAQEVLPQELPQCDVLEMDCEGAELDILRGIEIRPRAIVVETHGFLNVTVEEVSEVLNSLGYEVVDEKVESKEHGVYVLTGKRTC